MQWSKLKKLTEERFADSVRGHIELHTTRYTKASQFMSRGWVTIDKKEVANFSTPENQARYNWQQPGLNERVIHEERSAEQAVEKGEFARFEFTDSCRQMLELSIDDALSHINPIIRALAIIDKRTGRRRLLNGLPDEAHPLERLLYDYRMKCEGLTGPRA